MTLPSTLDPDAVRREFVAERAAAHVRLGELARKATTPGGLNRDEVAEFREKRAFVEAGLAGWMAERGAN